VRLDQLPEIVGTPTHPFWSVTRNEWVLMGQLKVEEELLLSTGESAKIVDLQVEIAPDGEGFTTYNFEVEDWHTYFAGTENNDSFVWVHNAGCKINLGERPHDFRPSTWAVLRERYPWAFDKSGKIKVGWIQKKSGEWYKGPLYNARHIFSQAEFKLMLEQALATAKTPSAQRRVLSFWSKTPGTNPTPRDVYLDWYHDPDRLWMGPTTENLSYGAEIDPGHSNILEPPVIDRPKLPLLHFFD
jgi:hypothetical protein